MAQSSDSSSFELRRLIEKFSDHVVRMTEIAGRERDDHARRDALEMERAALEQCLRHIATLIELRARQPLP